MRRRFHFIGWFGCVLGILSTGSALAAPPTILPGAADAGRVRTEERVPEFKQENEGIVIPESSGSMVEAPESAKKIHFVLQQVEIEGSSIFSKDELAGTYEEYLGKKVTLDVAWKIAGNITKLYHEKGFFLSRAYVPAQSVDNGLLKINIGEGYIRQVKLQDAAADNYVVREYISDLKAQKPVKVSEVESFLLRLNDLPGLSFRAVLSAMPDKTDNGAVLLTLVPSYDDGHGVIGFDNNGSRFLGPYEATASYQASIIPLQNTNISAVTSLPWDELKAGTISQEIALWPGLTLNLNGGYTDAEPGYNLEQFEIESKSATLGIALNYQLIRQRDENLSFKLSLDGRNTNSDILNTALTRDRVRALRLGVNFDIADELQGVNNGSLIISRGLDILSASQEGELNLSRGDAIPDFTKVELFLSRSQGISDNFIAIFSASGQLSSDPLFSSEEFGYGGQAFGRAYDSSEITGDDGINGSIELRYTSIGEMEPIGFTPYVFYDIGKVWNDSPTQADISGSSAGFGTRFTTNFHMSGNLGIAFPLTLPQSTPIYGYANGHNPRLMFQINQQF